MDHYEPHSRSSRRPPPRDRPPPPTYDDRPPPPQPDMFQFRGAANRNAGDSYRPGGGSGSGRREDFNFQAGNAPTFTPVNDYPAARRGPRDARRPPPRNGRGRGNFRGGRRFGPKPAHDRDLMRRGREPTPDQLEGMNEGQESRFRVLDNLSGSDSEEMDMDSDDDNQSHASAVEISDDDSEEEDHPRAKRARVKSPQESAPEKPKWSNPDPYTALPPPDATEAKKKDVVKLIRKAKTEAAKPAASAAEGADFISLNFDDDFAQEGSDDEEEEKVASPPRLPHKSSFSHLNHLHPDRNLPPPPALVEAPRGINMSMPALPLGGRLDVWPPPAMAPPIADEGRNQYNTGLQRQNAMDAPAPLRKNNNKKRKDRDDYEIGSVVEEWLCPGNADPAPWFANKLKGNRAEKWLHNEILDFYDYVKPRDFEAQVRNDLIRRIEQAVRRDFPALQVRAFGSFASGLYLPTADMDLVACSSQFLNHGISTLSMTRKLMFKFSTCLKRAGIADESSVTVISSARVPLVKFVEKVTGLRVDVSFENDSGLIANRTFQVWKQQYPAMPIIVALIKQFLVMRGFSEVFQGGIGGYSVICLVITTLNNLKTRNAPGWDAMENLDAVLMTFLLYFGREFDVSKDGLQMEPLKIVNKRLWRSSNNKVSKPDRLLIIDPNNYDNDISGGSSLVTTIFGRFEDAFRELNKSMSHAEDTNAASGDVVSILERTWGGNYELFEVQRDRLKRVWQNMASAGASKGKKHEDKKAGNQGNGFNGQGHGQSSTQGKSGEPSMPSQEGGQNNQSKQSRRAARGESQASKKQTKGEKELKKDPLYIHDTRHNAGNDNNKSGPAAAAGKRKRASTDEGVTGVTVDTTGAAPQLSKKQRRKNRTKTADEIKQEKNRAESFRRTHPNVTDVPEMLDKKQFRGMVQKHGKGL